MNRARAHNQLVAKLLASRLLAQPAGAARAVGRFEAVCPNLSAADICRGAVDAYEVALSNAQVAAAGGGFPRGIEPLTLSELDPHRAEMAAIFVAFADEPVTADQLAARFSISAEEAAQAFKGCDRLREALS